MTQANQELHELARKEYEHGFITDIEADTLREKRSLSGCWNGACRLLPSGSK